MHHPAAGVARVQEQRGTAQASLAVRVHTDSRIDPKAPTSEGFTPASAGLPAEVACCTSCCRAGLLTTARSAEPGKLPTSASPNPTTSSMYTSSLLPVSREGQSDAGACGQVSVLAFHTPGRLCSVLKASAHRLAFWLLCASCVTVLGLSRACMGCSPFCPRQGRNKQASCSSARLAQTERWPPRSHKWHAAQHCGSVQHASVPLRTT